MGGADVGVVSRDAAVVVLGVVEGGVVLLGAASIAVEMGALLVVPDVHAPNATETSPSESSLNISQLFGCSLAPNSACCALERHRRSEDIA